MLASNPTSPQLERARAAINLRLRARRDNSLGYVVGFVSEERLGFGVFLISLKYACALVGVRNGDECTYRGPIQSCAWEDCTQDVASHNFLHKMAEGMQYPYAEIVKRFAQADLDESLGFWINGTPVECSLDLKCAKHHEVRDFMVREIKRGALPLGMLKADKSEALLAAMRRYLGT